MDLTIIINWLIENVDGKWIGWIFAGVFIYLFIIKQVQFINAKEKIEVLKERLESKDDLIEKLILELDLYKNFSSDQTQDKVAREIENYKSINNQLREQRDRAEKIIENTRKENRLLKKQNQTNRETIEEKDKQINKLDRKVEELDSQLKEAKEILISRAEQFQTPFSVPDNSAFISTLNKISGSSTDIHEFTLGDVFTSPNPISKQIENFIQVYMEGKEGDDKDSFLEDDEDKKENE